MRLTTLLPMLLLLVSPLAAQNCHIFDLSASVVQFDPVSSCQFFVVLDFQHDGTTNQFTVHGNGNNYGTFAYTQAPVTIGPLFASPNGPSNFEFIVQDAVFQDCFDVANIEVPACPGTALCDISDLTVDVGDCHPLTGTYNITVNFQVSNPGNGFFELHAGNNVNLGIFPLAALPLTIPNFPWNGGANDVLKVCINDQPNCCETIEFPAPNCFNPCGIFDLVVLPGDCISDSTYKVGINFHLLNSISLLDSFKLYLDGSLQGTFGLNQLPLPAVFETSGNAHAVVKICVTLPTGLDCCLEKEFTVPVCLAPCAIQNLKVETDTCTSDSTFGIWVNFQVVDSTAVDSFSLSGNGHPLGTFAMDQLPLNIPNFLWNGLIFNHIRVCTGDDPGCCKEYQFLAPDCLPFDTCEVTNIFVQTGPCTSDSTYKVTLNFNATNPGNGTFIVWTNGTLLDTFDLSEVPLIIPDFPWNGGANDVVTVCIGGSTSVPGTTGCCESKEFAVPACLGTCDITDLHVEAGDCDPNTGTYPLTINFNVSHPGNDNFDVYANNQLIGTFPLNQLPLQIPNYQSSGNNVDVIKVCINDTPDCCATTEFQTPNCDTADCHIFDLSVQVGDCNPAGGYNVTINFVTTNPGNDQFDVYANGQLFGTYPLSQLPLHIDNFPASGNAFDHIKVCVNDQPNCCIEKEFQAPNCGGDCHIFDLSVQVGDCNAAGGYQVIINFVATNPGNDQFDVFANGQLFGTYPLNQLPLTIPNFPGSGNPVDHIKVCINDQPNCCIDKEFQAPNCNGDCHIFDLSVQVGDCNPNGGYNLTINFVATNPGNDQFDVYANGQLFGTYPLNQLPLTIPNFPASGNPFDHIKVCINDHPNCCIDKEFLAPVCAQCEIFDLHVETGDCNPDNTYHLTLNFGVGNTSATEFIVFGNGINLGTFNLNQLPLTIPNFPWDNAGPNDFLKVCIIGSNIGGLDCCETIEFPIPDCLHPDCDINDLHVEVGDCSSDSSYHLTFNFQAVNPPANTFGVWANGQFLGMYGLGQLPITIDNFPWNGGNNDVLKVCFANAAGGPTNCCAEIEFAVPSCLFNNNDCEIYDMVVDPGTCTSDSTYSVFLNFMVHNPLSNTFSVWANNELFGTYNLNQLPLTIPNFPWNGGNNDVIKVCFVSPNGVLGCCKTIEFEVPDCLGNGGDCEIVGMVVDPGDCNSDSTYSLFLNFQAVNPPGNTFGVWANGVFQGSFNLNQLPLNFPNFPWNGGNNDVIKVCFLNSAGAATCCKTLEFEVPACLINGGNCHIWDVFAVHTECLCGQFFVALTFNHENGGVGGFDIVGNGNNYGTHPYNFPQPIILGPFPGDNSTVYEFGIVDHENGDCEDGFVLGTVECVTAVVDPTSHSSLVISPNPASSWVNVTAMLENGTNVGQATVKIYHADGRLLQTQMVGNAASFQLDISNLPSGVYRMSIQSSAGRLDGSFTKQ